MSYVIGTDLGRLRELIGDTSDGDDELFGDEFLNGLLADYTIGRAAVVALTRLVNDPRLMMLHFRGMGMLSLGDLASMQRVVREQIDWVEKSFLSAEETPSGDERFPEADQTSIGRSTDEDGWFEPTPVDTYITDLEQRE